MTDKTPTEAPPLLPLALDAYINLPTSKTTWLVEGLIPTSGIVNIFSSPKVGKSYWALDLARALSQGEHSWLGHIIPNQERVLYLQLDTPRSLWIDRMKHMQDNGIDFTTNEATPEVPNTCDYFHIADVDQVPYPFNICEDETKQWIRNVIATLKPALVIIDTLREIHDLDEDKATPMKVVFSNLVAATAAPEGQQRPALLIISHSRKESPKFDGGLMQEGRGANYVAGRCDNIIRLRGKDGSDTCTMLYKGRASGHVVKVLTRNPKTIVWELKDDPQAAAKEAWKADVAAIMKNPDHKGKSWAERGRILNALHPDKKHDACVAALKRFKW